MSPKIVDVEVQLRVLHGPDAEFITAEVHVGVGIVVVLELARICSDATIANVLNRNGRRTGRGNFWTSERITALRIYHSIPVCSDVSPPPKVG